MQGILLAAGFGRRFDPSGRDSKLLAPLPDGRSVATHAAAALCAALPGSLAVIRPGQPALAAQLRDAGCRIIESAAAEGGMGHALADAVRASGGADGWLVALADMPWLDPELIRAVAAAVRMPDDIAAATFAGRRGHPVAFGAAHRTTLCALKGDQGARELLRNGALHRVDSPDDTVLRDIDRPEDLPPAPPKTSDFFTRNRVG